ncbi:G patch domain and ankyrin repeat-containing protein 1 [Artibeus jamaicensis]|uniref:G patch domain and ankyrin repeat-containing protein 1 n=1 Tax=Artibeus jamaicensis TaxID=9417 RepID=UPI00235A5C6B|nr:G patch domain and ankyrin repeat-containing protein 1 [Artibeus jamaicensis]XP_037007383.2 G patch domain and ankyrin repeat-containing protein 1 [Artibeus jamaicensis]XP_037007385.2 G patch domain and ankyrin repeat-containing protein 1 [Artibeus jamaicensis]XP_037007386.2 G patch domain and ankyrin repeat-containing protein 1 [Artibeus jamaicensis]XP_053523393.1 G patch domain and ankyrin repeat-containing protein 1 [Artibeus jamaicensis]XP_053523394.1 G patch domain and ankyrin repeat-c
MSRPSVITFTPATDPSDFWKDGQQQSQPEELEPTLDGAAARAFYEALIGDESSAPEPQRLKPEPNKERKRKKRRMMREAATGLSGGHGQRRSLEAEDKMTHWILRAAQEGDLAELKRLLDPPEAGGAGGNINVRDAFWWTPLMCAARAGQGAAVQYLLGQGAAWVGVCELGGRDAAQLAEEAGFPEVARMVRESRGEKRSSENWSQAPSPQYCETCGGHFQDSNHCTSTAHLLSLSRDLRPPSLHLGVPISSPGFKLLLKGGWEPGMGLGPQGKGRVNPIPTVLKRDQEGLGYRSAPQSRVTHFPAQDSRAVAGRARAPQVTILSRREERRQKEKDKAWERDLRRYMNLEF